MGQLALQLPNQKAGLSARYSHVAGRRNGPEEAHSLLPGTYEHVPTHGKRDFATVIKLDNLRKCDQPGLSRWAQLQDSLTVEKLAQL